MNEICRMTMNSSIECKVYSFNSCVKFYGEYYEWLNKMCEKDKRDIIKKQIEYLDECYSDLISKIKKRMNDEETYSKLMEFTNEFEDVLEEYLEDNREEYQLFESNKNKNSKYYSNLCSWYDMTIDDTDDIVNSLYNKVSHNNFQFKYNNSFMTTIKFIEKGKVEYGKLQY